MTTFPEEVTPREFIDALIISGYGTFEQARSRLLSMDRAGLVLLTNRYTIVAGSISVEEAFISVVEDLNPVEVENSWAARLATVTAFATASEEAVRRADTKASSAA